MLWNGCSPSAGICVHDAPEYAFKTFLNNELPKKPVGDWKIGADVFNTMHETKYMFDDDDIHLRRIARGMPGFTRVPAYHDWGRKQFRIVERVKPILS